MSDETVVVRSDQVRVRHHHHLSWGHRGLLALVDVFGKPYVVFHTDDAHGWALARHRLRLLQTEEQRALHVDVDGDPHRITFADDAALEAWRSLLAVETVPA
jgi:hypothetical protein